MSHSFTLHPIGTIHTPWRSIGECPRNGRQHNPAPPCTVQLFPDFSAGLQSLDGFSHLILLYLLHETKQPRLVFTPPFDTQPRGIFATRAPWRPIRSVCPSSRSTAWPGWTVCRCATWIASTGRHCSTSSPICRPPTASRTRGWGGSTRTPQETARPGVPDGPPHLDPHTSPGAS